MILELYNKLVDITQHGKQPKTTLLFTHEHLVNKLASYLGLFEHFPLHGFDEDDNLCLPMERNWFSAFVMPFNANFAAALYRCGKEYKLFTMFNEIPVKIKGCSSELCDLNEFFESYKTLADTCNLDHICPGKI